MRSSLVLTFTLAAITLSARDHATLSGRVMDSTGHPLAHATVFVYHAGVKKGYSTFCPSCYSDCGKKALTNQDGLFVIEGVDP